MKIFNSIIGIALIAFSIYAASVGVLNVIYSQDDLVVDVLLIVVFIASGYFASIVVFNSIKSINGIEESEE